MTLAKWKPLSSPAEASLLCRADKLMRENTAYIDTCVASSRGDTHTQTQRERETARGGGARDKRKQRDADITVSVYQNILIQAQVRQIGKR